MGYGWWDYLQTFPLQETAQRASHSQSHHQWPEQCQSDSSGPCWRPPCRHSLARSLPLPLLVHYSKKKKKKYQCIPQHNTDIILKLLIVLARVGKSRESCTVESHIHSTRMPPPIWILCTFPFTLVNKTIRTPLFDLGSIMHTSTCRSEQKSTPEIGTTLSAVPRVSGIWGSTSYIITSSTLHWSSWTASRSKIKY